MNKTIMNIILLACVVVFGVACDRKFANVPPNDIGMVLTPTGYEDKIYTPGQVDIGEVDMNQRGNRLVLVQRSGIQMKEQFIGSDGSSDKEDHRCLTANRAPMSLDVRLLFALPDYEKPDGKKAMARIFTLGNPKVESSAEPQGRVLRISSESIYAEQAQQQVRGKIRQICAGYADFDKAFASFGDEGESGFTKRIERAVAVVLKEQGVPLNLVSAFVSNMKPDKSVVDAISAKQAADKRVEAIRTLTDFLNGDHTGARWKVYNMQVLQEIVQTGNANGHNTIVLTTGSAAGIIPVGK